MNKDCTIQKSPIQQLLYFCLLFCSATVWGQKYDSFYKDLPCEVKAVEPFVIPDQEVSITEYGAIGDGITLCTEAFEQAIEHLATKGGGRVIIPEGVWLTGPIKLKDHIELRVQRNAMICFSPDKRLYTKESVNGRVSPCIYASNCQNIAITGAGVIDGNGQQWRPVKRSKMSDVEWKRYQEMGGQVTDNGTLWYPWQLKNQFPDIADSPKQQEARRNDLIRLEDCKNILVEGVTIQNAPRFHLHPCFCENIIIDGVNVQSEWNVQNGDGIDLSDCHRALIVNSRVSVGDDGICMKSGNNKNDRLAGCEDIIVENNTVNHGHGGFVFGSETVGGMRRMVVRHNTFSGTDIGLRFKSSIGRGGRSKQIFISDIMMNDITGEAISFQCNYVNMPAGYKGGKNVIEEIIHIPQFRDIHIDHVICRGCKTGIKAAGIQGLECVKDITIENSTIKYTNVDRQIDEETAQLTLLNVVMTDEKGKQVRLNP